MVAKFFINGGNTSDPLNYSLSSGGPNDTGVPTSADDLTFDQAVNATVDSVLTLKDINYTTNNSLTLNADIEVHGDVAQTGSGNWTDGGGFVRCRGNVNVSSVGNQAEFEFIGDDTNLTLGANMRIRPTLNKNVGKKLIITQSAFLNSFNSDWVIEEGILDLGAFDLSGSGDITMNGGAVTSTTGILDQERYFLNGTSILDPFKCISSTNSNSDLLIDSANIQLMPSGGDFEFTGANHWKLNQNFTVFPHLIINKCPTCGLNGPWYAQDVTIKNNSKWGGDDGHIRGNVIKEDAGFNQADAGVIIFDGTEDQTVTGEIAFDDLVFNKISGTLTFNDDFRVKECHNISDGDGIDFGSTLCHIFNTSGHLFDNFWEVGGLSFGSIELEIATSGQAEMNDTIMNFNFIVTQCSTLDGNLVIGGDVEVNDSTVGGDLDIILNGDSDQNITVDAGASSLNAIVVVNKNSGSVIQQSNIGSITLNASVIKGIWCTNEFDFDAEDLTILAVQAEFQKTPSSTVTVVNAIDGTITNVQTCGKKNSTFLAV